MKMIEIKSHFILGDFFVALTKLITILVLPQVFQLS